ncbi:B- and T-lymphocyte attenuator isoform X2 [Rhinatrema bivittatum]|uniref:B- and T-lymphocyte attenuator isoform X2 n=1 Tax=Rhinatrema bivittatum TaxID=194408 RepID=UPI001125E0B9|nr:B- and T-lymphocyte attenuator isoform X2 [Rhinatrema bivittatum]
MLASAAMWSQRTLLSMLCSLALLMAKACGDDPLCAPEINFPRRFQYHSTAGESLVIHCPVRYDCSPSRPNVTWCKLKGDVCIPVQEEGSVSTRWMYERGHSGDFVLNLASVELNDTGLYRCKAELFTQAMWSQTVIVTVKDTANSTQSGTGFGHQYFSWLVYVASSLGALCLSIIMCSLLVCSLKRYRERFKKPQDAGPQKTNQVIYTAAQQSLNLASSAPEEEASAYYYSVADFPQSSQADTIYDNDNPAYHINSTKPKPSSNASPNGSNKGLAKSQDFIVYAALNLSVNEPGALRAELTAVEELTEYAAICVRK